MRCFICRHIKGKANKAFFKMLGHHLFPEQLQCIKAQILQVSRTVLGKSMKTILYIFPYFLRVVESSIMILVWCAVWLRSGNS